MGVATGAAVVGAAAAAASAGNAIANSGGGSGGTSGGGFASGSNPPNVYQPQAQPQFDQLYQSILNSISPTAASLPPQLIQGYQNYLRALQQNPYAGGAQSLANQIASLGGGGPTPQTLPQSTPGAGAATAPVAAAPGGGGGGGFAAPPPGVQLPAGLTLNQLQSDLALPTYAKGAPQYGTLTAAQRRYGYARPITGYASTNPQALALAKYGLTPQSAGALASSYTSQASPSSIFNNALPNAGGAQPSAAVGVSTLPPIMSPSAAGPAPGTAGGGAAAARPGGIAGQEIGFGNQLAALAGLAGPAAAAIFQQGFDPRQALYDRTAQQIRDAANATNASMGLSTSPYGAGLTNQALSNFNIDWQNQQLQREAQAASAYGGLGSTAGKLYGGAADLYSGGLNTLQTTGLLPYQTYLQQQNDLLGGYNTLSTGAASALGIPQSLLNNIQSYLGLGQSAAQTGLNAANARFANNQRLGAGLSNSLSGLGSSFGNLGKLFGSGGGSYYGTPKTAGTSSSGIAGFPTGGGDASSLSPPPSAVLNGTNYGAFYTGGF